MVTKRNLLIALFLLLGLSGLLLPTVKAALTDRDTTEAPLTVGTIDLTLVNSGDLSINDLVPGAVKYSEYTLKNDGTLPVLIGATTEIATDSGPLAPRLLVDIKKNVETCGNPTSWTNTGTLISNGGATLASSVLIAPSEATQLASAATVKLCIRVTLNAATPSTLQNKTLTGKIVFSGIQRPGSAQ